MIEARSWPFQVRAARKLAKLMYLGVGIRSELTPWPYAEAFHETQSIHIHVPKTAGNSARDILYGLPSRKLGGHMRATLYREASPALFSRYFVFATVRHPLARLRSAFHYLKRGGMSAGDRRWGRKNLSAFQNFDAFVLALRDESMAERVRKYVHFRPQSMYVCDAEGNLIMDYLVRMEDFENGMRHVCDRLGLPYVDRHVNAAVYDKADPTPELDAICRKIYPTDYRVLGY